MSLVGTQLRSAREARNLDLRQAAETIKIRTDYLAALEAGDFSPFVAPVYIRGFVRTYATLLKLDVPKVMADLDRELAATEKFSEPPPLSIAQHGPVDFVLRQLSRVNWARAKVAVGLVPVLLLAVAIALVWRHFQKADPLAGLRPPVYQSTQTVAGDSLPLPPVRR